MVVPGDSGLEGSSFSPRLTPSHPCRTLAVHLEGFETFGRKRVCATVTLVGSGRVGEGRIPEEPFRSAEGPPEGLLGKYPLSDPK